MKTEKDKEVTRARRALRAAFAAVCPNAATIEKNLKRVEEALWAAGKLTRDQETK